MCDIWKGNKSVKQLHESDIENLVVSLKKLKTRWVVMSGGEALMHPNFFRLSDILSSKNMKIILLSTGLLVKKYAQEIAEKTDQVIVSLDGSEKIHDEIRRVPGAYTRLKEGVQSLKKLKPDFSVIGRCVIQRLNFLDWPNIIDASRDIGLDQISFLPADISTPAFNRPNLWESNRINEVGLSREQLDPLRKIIERIIITHAQDFSNRYIVESPGKLRRFYTYYAAFHRLNDFPAVQCNAPWVSAVVESDGNVKPCFFHPMFGNLNQLPLEDLVNSPNSITFRKNLDVRTDPVCKKCVCSLNLSPLARI